MTELSFIPPFARKKLHGPEIRHIHDHPSSSRKTWLIPFGYGLLFFSFVVYNLWYITGTRRESIEESRDIVSRSQGSLRRRAWVSGDSQPFVSWNHTSEFFIPRNRTIYPMSNIMASKLRTKDNLHLEPITLLLLQVIASQFLVIWRTPVKMKWIGTDSLLSYRLERFRIS